MKRRCRETGACLDREKIRICLFIKYNISGFCWVVYN